MSFFFFILWPSVMCMWVRDVVMWAFMHVCARLASHLFFDWVNLLLYLWVKNWHFKLERCVIFVGWLDSIMFLHALGPTPLSFIFTYQEMIFLFPWSALIFLFHVTCHGHCCWISHFPFCKIVLKIWVKAQENKNTDSTSELMFI